MDGPSRARVVLGTVAVLVATLASLALLNVLLEEPLPLDNGNGDDGGPSGGSLNFEPPSEQPGQSEEPSQPNRSTNPCDTLEPIARTSSLVTMVVAMGLWVSAVWWRQKRQTRVLNGFAIAALLVTLVGVTLMFAWWIIHKVCALDIFDLQNCLEIAHSLRDLFFFFLVGTIGLLGWSVIRKRKGLKFWSLWSIGGFVFVYLMVLGLVGWQVAEDMCERQFKQPDLDDFNPPDGSDNPPGGTEGEPNPPSGGGSNPGFGGGTGGGPGSGGGGAVGPVIPQVSPFALLVIIGIAALVTVLVLAVKGRQNAHAAAAMAAMNLSGGAGMLRLFMDTDLESNDAVVKTYRTFLDQCMYMGVEKKPTETPLEHGARAAPALDLSYAQLEPLLGAYQHVRLADGPLTAERRGIALGIASLFRPRVQSTRRRRR